MSAAESMLWRAFDKEPPVSDTRGDIQIALAAPSVFQAQGKNVPLEDVLPRWLEPKANPTVVWQDFFQQV